MFSMNQYLIDEFYANSPEPIESKASDTLINQDIDQLFNDFLARNYNNSNLSQNKKYILEEVYSNLGLNPNTQLTPQEYKLFAKELNSIVHLNSELPNLINHTDEFEDPNSVGTQQEKLAIIARNLLKHLIRGTSLCSNDGEAYTNSLLAQEPLIKTLLTKRDQRLLRAFRQEMQKLLINAFAMLTTPHLSPSIEKQYEIFQSTFLSSYPFMDPKEGEEVSLPQKINNQWEMVSYRFTKLDVSPKSGPLSWVLEEEDRMYAYALNPQVNNACAHLLLMGTTYPAGQGSGLAVAYNFYPGHSVGEGHNTTEIDRWFAQQKNKNVKVTGHSKGATMAMISAARHPHKIIQADCLNPAGLSASTLKRLNPFWNKLQPERQPVINVYAQLGDPVFPLGKGFLKGTNIYRVIPNTHTSSMNCGIPLPCSSKKTLSLPTFFKKGYEAHIHQFAGRSNTLFLKVNTEKASNTNKRKFFDDVKNFIDWFRFPLEYVETFTSIVVRKAKRFYKNHRVLAIGLLVLTTASVCMGLAASGLILPVLAGMGIAATPAAVSCISVGLSVIAAALVPPILKYTGKLVQSIVKAANSIMLVAAHVAAISLGSTFSGMKLGIKRLWAKMLPAKKVMPDDYAAKTKQRSGFVNGLKKFGSWMSGLCTGSGKKVSPQVEEDIQLTEEPRLLGDVNGGSSREIKCMISDSIVGNDCIYEGIYQDESRLNAASATSGYSPILWSRNGTPMAIDYSSPAECKSGYTP